MSLFDKDFFPTPRKVIDQMLEGVLVEGKVALEPSAGSGNIVKALKERGATQVLTYEKNKDLAKIVQPISRFMGYDFLKSTPEELSHVDLIVMNPPFSQDGRHILHAWNIAPEGCEIIALCNTQTVKNQYSRSRQELYGYIENYGATEELGSAFSDAERKTNVGVSIVRLFKPVRSEGFDYEGFYMDVDESEFQREGLMRYSEIRSIVSRYVSAVRLFDEFEELAGRMDHLVSPVGLSGGFSFSFGYNDQVTTKDDFAVELQRRSWKMIFNKMQMDKFITSGVMEDVNKFIERQQQFPFTMRNIYVMLGKLIADRENIMDRALVDAFDSITRHYHENRYAVEGWKTNSHYMINRKFILPYAVEVGIAGGFQFQYHGSMDKIRDLSKALAYITAQPDPLADRNLYGSADHEFGKWFDLGFFQAKGYKKGTIHCKFKDEEVWWLFNQRIAKIKGYPLPENVKKAG